MRIHRPELRQASRQSAWIVAMEPWRSLGYQGRPLGRYLRRMAMSGQALVAEEGGRVLGIVVFQPDFLLGLFVALLAVRPEAAGCGLGRALMAKVEGLAFPKKRWLWVSCDGENRAAARFYRKLGFLRMARLPALIRDGRTEVLWRKGAGRLDGASQR
jgi:ribosomal protein S18 acetylase RimI-like enzyme